ncbi:MAG: hypothetical protein RBS17_02055 [Coriobacteriia bacterium]|nr:hypothetical protein [Coriobacteriia bacterium]
MVRDNDLITDDLAEVLGKAAEPLNGSARMRIRERVMAEVHTGNRSRLFMLASHRFAAAMTAIAMLGGGVAYATERSLPGAPLYGLKIAAENAAVAVLPPGKLENRLLVTIAARRAGETAGLARRGSEPKVLDDSLGMLREAIRQATPAEGTLGEDEAVRIRERGSDAPTRTREAIDEAVSTPMRQTTPADEGTGGRDGKNDQPQTGDSADGPKADIGTQPGTADRLDPAQQDTAEPNATEQSREMNGNPGLR